MYAVVAFQGFQYRVQPEDRIQVPSYPAEVGEGVTLDRVMLISDGDQVTVGRPTIPGAAVDAEVVSHLRGPKIIVGKFKRRKDYRRRKGYRSDLTELRIRGIQSGSQAPGRGEEAAAAPAETTEGGQSDGA
ncbi:MAG: 50S ribosomal protein L21 [Candidatus Eisenbacteria bacterium]|nr:50S ribosomal protein L21 [Candidatus Eisenbacteria bacterium]